MEKPTKKGHRHTKHSRENSMASTTSETEPMVKRLPLLLDRRPVDLYIWKELFDPRTLCAILQQKKPPVPKAKIRKYVDSYDASDVQRLINQDVEGYPPLFYAVEYNDPELIRLLVNVGADVKWQGGGVWYALTFAICCGEQRRIDTTEVVRTLLELGADPQVIPPDMWNEYMEQPRPDTGERAASCEPTYVYPKAGREMLARNLTLTQRYLLYRADKMERPAVKVLQLAREKKMTGLLGLPLYLIGQEHAVQVVQDEIICHLLGDEGRERPLNMVFAGPSGHGKTELARSLGKLLSIPQHVVDCTEIEVKTDLFGPKKPFQGWENGAPLNNFLASYSGQRSIVFMDEFEKMGDGGKAHDTLLKVLDEGIYIDRRKGTAIDCTKTTWVFATNLVDPLIIDFYSRHLEKKSAAEQAAAPFRTLDKNMRKAFKAKFGIPLGGRLGSIIPFLPFSTSEAAVVAHKCLRSLAEAARPPMQPGEALRMGGVFLEVREDGAVCRTLAEDGGYDVETGARSLERAVHGEVGRPLRTLYLRTEGEMGGGGETVERRVMRFVVQVRPEGDEKVVRVFREEDVDLPVWD